jgi:cullin-associated NEDD8-dissociated protein 1
LFLSQALQKFFASLVQSANTSFETLLDSLISTAKPSQSGGLSKQALSSIAQCVAVLCLAAGDQKCASTIEMLKGILKDDSSANSVSIFMDVLCSPDLHFACRTCELCLYGLTDSSKLA